MKSKHLHKVAMILSCIGLTNLHSTKFDVIAEMSNTRLFSKILELEDQDIGLAEQAIKDIGQWNRNNPLAKKLFNKLNDSTSREFYDFVPKKINIEHKTLELNALVVPVAFRVENFEYPSIHYLATRIHILEPGIENNVFVKLSGNINAGGVNINAEGVYSRWEDLVDIVTDGGVRGVHSNDRYLWRMSNLNQMPELLRTLNFSRSLAGQTDRSVDDIMGFLSCLDSSGFKADEMAIIKHSEAKHYSLNLICDDSLMAELRFEDESDGAEWYQDEYATARRLYYCGDPIFPDIVDGRSFILESITLGTYTYTFTLRVDLLKKHNGVTLLDTNPNITQQSDTIQRRLETHIKRVFSANRIGREHRNLKEAYNRIDLKKVMQGIEQDFATNNPLANALVAPVAFRVENFEKFLDLETKIHILEPGIENNVFLYILGNTNAKGVYRRWEDLVDILPYDGRVRGVHYSLNDHYLWNMDNLNQIAELLRTLNFSRSLAKQTNRSVHDIRCFLSSLDCSGFDPNQMTIIKRSEAKHYSLNLMYRNSLMAELHFKDESDGAEWYQDEYATVRRLYSEDNIFPDIVDGRSFILESITLGTYTYKFRRPVDLLKKHNGVTLLDTRPRSDTIQRRLKTHIKRVFSANRIGREHRNLKEAYNRIDLKKVMQGIEFYFK